MKKITYAVLGSLMVTTAVLLRTLGDGGSELMALVLIGVVLMLASEDNTLLRLSVVGGSVVVR